MPELPEVEAARRAVEEHCVGKTIKRAVVADDPKVIDGVSHSEFESSVTGKTIVAALRKGKSLWFRLDSPPFPSFQFGMAGAVYIKGVAVTKYKRSSVKDEHEWPSKYSKVFLELDDGLELSFTDKRRFAKVRLLQDPASVPPISELGPDALLEFTNADELVESLRTKRTGIKALLLDQSYISGIGNWIADEVLYQAKIHPLQIASNLSKESCELLHKCIKEVVQYSVEVDADSSRFPAEWLFHFRWGKKSGKMNDSSQFPNNWIFHSREKKPGKAYVDGRKIEFITAGGRTSAFVPELQKLIGSQSGKVSGKTTKTKVGRKTGNKKVSVSEDEPDTVEDSKNGSDQEGDLEDEFPIQGKAAKGKSKSGNAQNESKKIQGQEEIQKETVRKSSRVQVKAKTEVTKKPSELEKTEAQTNKKARKQ